MSGNRKSSRAALAVMTAVVVAVSSGLASATAGARAIGVERATVSRPIPPGFVGLSMEYRGLAAYAGTDPNAVDPVFEQLLRAISPNQSPVLRVGGDSTDWTWWPVPHMRRPPGVKYDLTPDFMNVARSLARTLKAKMILGINLEADSRRVASAEAGAIVHRIGRSSIDALELGNEPELYGSFGWYRSASGQQVPGRPAGYNVLDFMHDFSTIARGLPAVALAGPSSGSPTWLAQLGPFLRTEPKVKLTTLHAYPLRHCLPSQVVTAGQLLSDQSSRGLADSVEGFVATAHEHGVRVRIDEMNAVSCGGERGVSDTFTSALWALDALFEMARIGVDGVNIHTVPGTINEVLGPSFQNGAWQMRVHPEYYGLIMFAQAAPPGSRLLRLAGQPPSGVKVWATSAPDRHIRVVVINKHVSRPYVVRLQLPSNAPASVEQLRAPSIGATTNVTFGGQSFGAETTTGLLAGPQKLTTLAPTGGTYVVRVPAASATMLTVPAG